MENASWISWSLHLSKNVTQLQVILSLATRKDFRTQWFIYWFWALMMSSGLQDFIVWITQNLPPDYHVSDPLKFKMHACVVSRVWLFSSPWTVVHQAPLSMGFSKQEYWSGLPFLSPGIFPTRDQTQIFSLAGRFFTVWAAREAQFICYYSLSRLLTY